MNGNIQILITEVENGMLVNKVTDRECTTFIADTVKTCLTIVEDILQAKHENIAVPDSIRHSTAARLYLGPGGHPPHVDGKGF